MTTRYLRPYRKDLKESQLIGFKAEESRLNGGTVMETKLNS